MINTRIRLVPLVCAMTPLTVSSVMMHKLFLVLSGRGKACRGCVFTIIFLILLWIVNCTYHHTSLEIVLLMAEKYCTPVSKRLEKVWNSLSLLVFMLLAGPFCNALQMQIFLLENRR